MFGKKKAKDTPTRVFFATDLHGSTLCFKKFLSAARVYEADVLIMGGDVAGKQLVPLLKQGDGVKAGDRVLTTEDEVREYVQRYENRGSYPVVCEQDELDALRADEVLASDRIMSEAAIRLEEWVRLAEERLKDTRVTCLMTGGNDDTEKVLEAVPEDGAMQMCEGRIVQIPGSDLEVASIGWSNPTPWKTPRETSEEDLRHKLRELLAGRDPDRRLILNCHVPPKASGLDRCAELDETTDPPTPVMIAGEVQMHDAGSTAVREAIEESRPLVGLHGHIHESRNSGTIGKSLVLNPGSTFQEGILQGALLVIGRKPDFQFTSG